MTRDPDETSTVGRSDSGGAVVGRGSRLPQGDRRRDRLFGWRFGMAMLCLAGTSPALARSADTVSVGVSQQLFLTARDQRSLSVSLTPGTWLATVEQHGIDVTLEVHSQDGVSLGWVDGPWDRRGIERFLFSATHAGAHTLDIVAREEVAPSGRVVVRVESVMETDARYVALTADTVAARRYHEGNVDGWRDAVAAHRAAASAWRNIGDEANEARAAYGAAVLLRLLADDGALPAAQAVLALWEAEGHVHWRACTLNEIGLGHLNAGDAAAARMAFERALALRVDEDEAAQRLELRQNICVTHLAAGHRTVARDCFSPLLDQLDDIATPTGALALLLNVAGLHRSLGGPDRALELYRDAHEKAIVMEDQRSAARARSGMAAALRDLGRFREAGIEDECALAAFEVLGDVRWQATTLNNLGYGLLQLGDSGRARLYFERALTLRRAGKEPRGIATTLENLATVSRREGAVDAALAYLEEARQLRHELGDGRGEAKALRLRATVEARAGRSEAATASLVRARLHLDTEDQHERALIDLEAARLALEGGRLDAGRRALDTLAERLQAMGDRRALVLARTLESRLALMSGDPELALRRGEEAIALAESLRDGVASAHLRATFLGEQRAAYEVVLETWLQVDQGMRRALEVSERARARSLLETLRPRGRPRGRGVDPVLIERRHALQARFNAKASSRLALAERGSRVDRRQLDFELATLRGSREAVDAEIRRTSPHGEGWTRPRVLDAGAMQDQLDDGTVALVYWLGAERSHLWWVTRDEIRHEVLPPRSKIESLARRVRKAVSVLDAGSAQRERDDRCALASTILGPVADRLTGQRLAVVADGPLRYVPFGLLPSPAVDVDEPLIERHEIVHLPSVSVLAASRDGAAQTRASRPRLRPETRPWLAVVADPVFSVADSRLDSRRAEMPLVAAPSTLLERGSISESLERLPGTQLEAAAIATLVPPARARLLFGFDATRERVLMEAFRGPRVVHFATHGIFDAAHPGLSGLALTQWDRTGAPVDGFLRFADLTTVELDAELVVLSGCETALGQAVIGEGLIGLTTGFLAAGAPRVVASAWRVSDLATAALMTAFHRSLWRDGRSPAAALRAAQRTVRQERAWRDPYFWAGFLLVGDWRAWTDASPPAPHGG